MASHLIEFSAAWREMLDLLENGKSTILISPRYYRKWSALERYARTLSTCRPIVLSSRDAGINGAFSYVRLWDRAKQQLACDVRITKNTLPAFLTAFQSALTKSDREVIAFVGGAGRGHEELHYKVLAALHSLISTKKLTIAATDDYSCFFYQKRDFLISDLHSLLSVQMGAVTADELRDYLRSISRTPPGDATLEEATHQIHTLSGGHVGLAEELSRGLLNDGWPTSGRTVGPTMEELLKRSTVLELIGHALEEDPEGYCKTALEYRMAACPEQNSPRIHVLRQLGVLQRESPPLVRLGGGAIARLVEHLQPAARVAPAGRVGTIVTEEGLQLFEGGPVELTDDDLVVVHISDIHVSERYRHRLTWAGGQWNPHEQSASELLHDDLASLGLLNRVDALVLTGDFVWTGSPTEFRRAEAVIKEIAAEMQLDISKVLLIPGNHDVEWNPGVLGTATYGKPVSRESYDDFLKILRKHSDSEVDVVELTSRSGRCPLLIVGVDSNRVEGPGAAGIGFVSRESLAFAKKTIIEFQARHGHNYQALVWMAVHHHVFPASSAKLDDALKRSVSVMANSAELLECANQLGVEVILHGHEHQPCMTVARRWPVDVGDIFKPIAALGAGSFGAVREYLGPFSHNHYFIVVRRPTGILIRSRKQGDSGVKFVAHSDIWLPRTIGRKTGA